MIVHDFRCEAGHVHQHYVDSGTTQVPCPTCGEPGKRVFLRAPNLDWAGMAQGESAGPEFIDRWERTHRKETEKQEKCLADNGDYGPGYAAPPTTQEP